MTRIDVMINEGKTGFRPGETLSGTVHWTLEKIPRKGIEVCLVWYTSGVGSRDAGVGDAIQIPCTTEQGSSAFSLTLPDGPYSFSGKLITLTWAVEAAAGKEKVFAELMLSPTGEEVRI